MSDIIYPTVDLFLYDLRDGLGQTPEEIKANQQEFQAKLPENINIDLIGDRQFEAEYVELLGQKRIERFGGSNIDRYEGFYYPVRQGDTYGLLLDCSINQQKNAQPAKCIKEIKAELDRRLQRTPPTVGKSWVIYGQLPDPKSQNPEDIAKICYRALLPDFDWQHDFQGQGIFGGANIFELSHFETRLEEKDQIAEQKKNRSIVGDRSFPEILQTSHHVIIILYPDSTLAETASELLNFHWMRLFCYRAKILWAYSQTRQLKQWLKSDYIVLENCIKQLRRSPQPAITLKQLDKILAEARQTFANYAIHLAYLEDFCDTIAINLENYNIRYREICYSIDSLVNVSRSKNDLKFLSKFIQQVEHKYLRQLEKESNFFRRGLNSLEILIETVRTSVELERTKRDRHFQNSVAIWGIGLAAGSIVADISGQFPIVVVPTVAANQENDPTQHPLSPHFAQLGIKDPWLTPAISTTVTLISTLVFALIIWGIIKLFEKRSVS